MTTSGFASSMTFYIKVTCRVKQSIPLNMKRLFTIALLLATQLTLLAQSNPVFEKLKKGVNQDVSMAFSGSFPKMVHERKFIPSK